MALKAVKRTVGGFRSKFEQGLAAEIRLLTDYDYEERVIAFDRPSSSHKYTPDFVLPSGVIIEAKGIFDAEDRSKHLLVKQQHPSLDLRFVFQNAKARLSKTSKTTYADWCDKHGFQWAHRHIPQEWCK
jgi:hypothetical protein